MEPGDTSLDAGEGAVQGAPCGKEAVRAWLRRRREARDAPPSIEQIRAELGWTGYSLQQSPNRPVGETH